jgi:predicted transposase YdaD
MGLAERIEKWTNEIKAEGKAERREQGIFEERNRVARQLLAPGTPVAQIQETTGLSEDDVALLG